MRIRLSPSWPVVNLSVALVGISLPCEKSVETEPPGCSTEMASPSDGGRASFLHAAIAKTNPQAASRKPQALIASSPP